MNEYNRCNYYIGLRLPGDMLRTLISEARDRHCLRFTIKARSEKCLRANDYVRKVNVINQLRVESQIAKTVIYLRVAYYHVTSIIAKYGIGNEYGTQKVWSLTSEMASIVRLPC